MQGNKKQLSPKETILYAFESFIMFIDIIMALSYFFTVSTIAGLIFLLCAFLISPFCEKLFQKIPSPIFQTSVLTRVGIQIICSLVLFIVGVAVGATQSSTNVPETKIETITITAKKETDASDKISTQDNLSSFLLALTPETARDEVEKLAKNYGLFVNYRNTGTGIYKYRFANSKKVAETINPEKGSVITASFNALHDNILEEITYFDEERMVGGFWKLEDGYSMIDYNNPQMITDSFSSQIAINSFDEVINYQPQISNKDNLLEELFMSVSESTTKNDIVNYAKEHNLAYTFRGQGNENLIAYSNDVIEKFRNEGSYISFDYDSNEIITHLAYFEYPYQYKTEYSANYYSESYPYSELVGYYLYAYQKDPIQYTDARTLIDEINKSREITAGEIAESKME